MDKRNLSDRYTDLRLEKGLSQTELAAALDCNKQYISKFEDGSRSLSLAMLEKYADFFGVSTDYLLGRTDVKTINADLAATCNYTGLSEEAIKILIILRRYKVYNFLSDFLEKADLFNLIIELDKLQANSEKVFEYLSGKFENNPGLNNSSTSEIFDISNHVSIYENPCDIAKYKIEEIIRDYLNKCDIRKYKTDINGNTWNEMQRALQNRYSECYEKDVKPLTDNPL